MKNQTNRSKVAVYRQQQECQGAFEQNRQGEHQKGRTKMRISRNKKRAQRLSKQLVKNFYIPKS